MEDVKETEWWWIDYLEDELDPTLNADLEMLLQHSQEDRDSFENFRLLRQWVRESDPVAAWPLEERMTRMRSKVMDAIKTEKIEQGHLDRNWREDLKDAPIWRADIISGR